MNGKATTKEDAGSLTLWRHLNSLELPIYGHYMKDIQIFILFPWSYWIFLLYAAKLNPNKYFKEIMETFQENCVFISVLKYFHCLVFCFCSSLAS